MVSQLMQKHEAYHNDFFHLVGFLIYLNYLYILQMRQRSLIFHFHLFQRINGLGNIGEPSYKTNVTFDAKAVTIHSHIIQPQVVKYIIDRFPALISMLFDVLNLGSTRRVYNAFWFTIVPL